MVISFCLGPFALRTCFGSCFSLCLFTPLQNYCTLLFSIVFRLGHTRKCSEPVGRPRCWMDFLYFPSKSSFVSYMYSYISFVVKLKMDNREIISLIQQMCPLQWPDTALAEAELYAALSWATWLACQPYCNLAFSLLFDSQCWRLICLREGWSRRDWKKANPLIVWSWWKSLISTPYLSVKTVHLVKLVLVWSRKV